MENVSDRSPFKGRQKKYQRECQKMSNKSAMIQCQNIRGVTSTVMSQCTLDCFEAYEVKLSNKIRILPITC